MSKFVVGDRIVGTRDGLPLSGEVTNSFKWQDSEGKRPKPGQIPVMWDFGEPSYVNEEDLDYELFGATCVEA